jgi:hypothetical protein
MASPRLLIAVVAVCATATACGRTGLDGGAGNPLAPGGGGGGGGGGGAAGRDAGPDLGVPPLPLGYALQCFPEVTGQWLKVAMSRDARWFLYAGDAYGTGPLRLFDRATRLSTTVVAAVTTPYSLYSVALSGDGRFAAYGLGAGNTEQIYVWERETGLTTVASTDTTGLAGDDENGIVTLSNDGRYVVFYSRSQNLSQPPPYWQGGVLRRDRAARTTALVSLPDQGGLADDFSLLAAVSDDGRFVAFQSVATNLAGPPRAREHAIYLRDLLLGHTEAVSPAPPTGVRGWAVDPLIAGDGSFVAFATGVDSFDTATILLWERTTHQLTTIARGFHPDDGYPLVGLSTDARYVAFGSRASNVVPDDGNSAMDGFVHDRVAQRTVRRTHDAAGGELARGGRPVALSGNGKTVAFVTASPEVSDGVHEVLCVSLEVAGGEGP